MKKIKVLHIIKTLNLGGAEINLLNLVKAMDRQRFDLHVAYASGGELEERFRQTGVKLFKFSEVDHKVKSGTTFGIVARLAGYLKRNNIDIVHTHTLGAHLWGSTAAKLTGRKVVEHVHDPRYERKDFLRSRGMEPVNGQQLVNFAARFSDVIIVLTKANQEYLHSLGIKDEKIRRLLNGIPLEAHQWPSRETVLKKFDIDPQNRVIFSAMRLSKEKNSEFILDIAALVKDVHPKSCFLVAGDGPQMPELKDMVIQRALQENVKFIGYYSNIPELMSASDIFILPTLRELHSISMVEAMSMNLAVLVSQGAGCNDEFIKHGEDGFLLDPYQPKQWADVIDCLLKDHELRMKIGQNALIKVKDQCDIKGVVSRIQGIYEQLVYA